MQEKIGSKDGSIVLKVAGTLVVIFGVLGILSLGFLQSSSANNLLTAEQIVYFSSPTMLFSGYWYGFLEIFFGVFAFYFASHPEKNALCQCFSLGIMICYVISSIQLAPIASSVESIISYVFFVVPLLYFYGSLLQKEYYGKKKQ